MGLQFKAKIIDLMVNAIIIGVQKCGTTTLANWISQHPQVQFCSQKEPDFFSRNPDWKEGLDAYHNLYGIGESFSDDKLWIEASTSYSWYLEFPDVATRLHEYNPELKLIYIVREPISRIKSHYKHNFLKGHTKKSFSKAVVKEPEYLAHSSYEVQARPFLNSFQRENLLFLKFEDLITREDTVLTKVFDFLDLPPVIGRDKFDFSPQNVSDSLKKVSPLKKFIAPLVRFLPLNWRLQLRKVFYRNHTVELDTSPRLEAQLYQLLLSDIQAFNNLTGIDYRR